MTDADLDQVADEIDQLLNDPATPIDPDRIWELAEGLASQRSRLTD